MNSYLIVQHSVLPYTTFPLLGVPETHLTSDTHVGKKKVKFPTLIKASAGASDAT